MKSYYVQDRSAKCWFLSNISSSIKKYPNQSCITNVEYIFDVYSKIFLIGPSWILIHHANFRVTIPKSINHYSIIYYGIGTHQHMSCLKNPVAIANHLLLANLQFPDLGFLFVGNCLTSLGIHERASASLNRVPVYSAQAFCYSSASLTASINQLSKKHI